MKVIMAGYSKTGTKTMAKLFEILGYNVYDFEEHFLYHYDEWQRIFNGEDPVPIFREMYKDVDTIMDVPVYHYWQQISEAFPEAKIILIERDTEKWKASVIAMFKIVNETRWFKQPMRTIMRPFLNGLSPTLVRFTDWLDFTFEQSIGPNVDTIGEKKDRFSRSHMHRMYEKHNEHVKAKAPKDKFLNFSLKDGWGPICKFLGKPVPKVEFPHSNQKGSIVGDIYEGMDNRKGRVVIESEIKKSLGSLISMTVLCGAAYFGHLKYGIFEGVEKYLKF